MPQNQFGIDISPDGVKLVEFAPESKIVSTACRLFIAEKDPQNPAVLISDLLKENKLSPSCSSIALCGPQINYQLVLLPVMPEKEVRSALRYKVEAELTFPPEEAVIAYTLLPLAAPGGGSWYQVALTQRSFLLQLAHSLKKVGLPLREIMPGAFALQSSLPPLPVKNCTLFYMGEFFSLVVLLKEGQVVFVREIKLARASMLQAMTGAFMAENEKYEIDAQQAETVLQRHGIPVGIEEYTRQSGFPAAAMMGMLRPVLEHFEVEILRTVEFYRQHTGDDDLFNHVYCLAQAERIKNLAEYFSASMGMKVENLPNPDGLATDFVMARGSLLAAKENFSLLPEDLRQEWSYKLRRGINVWTILIAYVLFFGFLLGVFQLRLAWLNHQFTRLQNELGEQGLLVPAADPLLSTKRAIGYRGGEKDRFIFILEQLGQIIPEGVFLQSLSYNNLSNAFNLQGVILKKDEGALATDLIEKLKEMGYFTSVDLSYLRDVDVQRSQASEFEIKASLLNTEL